MRRDTCKHGALLTEPCDDCGPVVPTPKIRKSGASSHDGIFNAEPAPASPVALPDEAGPRACVKCGHLQNDARRRGADAYGSFCIYGCGCDCKFPTPPSTLARKAAEEISSTFGLKFQEASLSQVTAIIERCFAAGSEKGK